MICRSSVMASTTDNAEPEAAGVPAKRSLRQQLLPAVLFGKRPGRTLLRLALLVATAYILFGHMLKPVRVTGISMHPTYRDGRIILINRWAYAFSPPQRGDVVAVSAGPLGQDRTVYLKRIVALPGETFAILDGWFIIDGAVLEEPYVHRPQRWRQPPMDLGFDEYYVVGDNRSMHQTLHAQGVARREHIMGRVLFQPPG